MKNYLRVMLAASVATAFLSCCAQDPLNNPSPEKTETDSQQGPLGLKDVAVILSGIHIGKSQMAEVYSAVSESSGNGYDEEYTMRDLFASPGTGVGASAQTKAIRAEGTQYDIPLRELIKEYLEQNAQGLSKAGEKGAAGAEELAQALEESDMQIYWPYSEDWDGISSPLITFDPGLGIESNYGYLVNVGEDGMRIVDSVYVDENVAKKRPVWVINRNSDSGFSPLQLFQKNGTKAKPEGTTKKRTLYMRSITMLRNYDSWFGGASEFWIKCGSVDGFKASTEAELRLYSPTVTDFIVVVKRKLLGQEVPFDAIIMTDFTNQLDKLAFLITEDDGGTRTSWKCSATVKIQSKSYGFDIDLPYNDRDDIVWRGQLSASYFQQEDIVTGRFGDVLLSFELE